MPVRSLALLAALISTSAFAQLPPITTLTQPYAPLTGATVGVPVGRDVSFYDADDEGVITVPLGFQFPYFGTNYDTAFIDTNGFIMLGNGAGAGCTTGCLSIATFPTAAAPGNHIAGFWEDFDGDGQSQIRYVLSSSELVVEWHDMPPYDFLGGIPGRISFQIRLTSSGLFTFHQGPVTGTLSGSSGFENSTGTVGANFLPGCTSSCNATHWTPNRLTQVGEPDTVDLGVSGVTVNSFVRLPDDNLTFTVNTTLRNFGRTGSDAGFEWAAYLSRDRSLELDGGDILVATATSPALPAVLNGVTADGGQATVALTANAATVTAPPTGEYYVLVLADSPNVIVEASETNNVGASATAFVQGVDLVASTVSGPSTSFGGADAGVAINFLNRGTSAPDASVPVRVLLSLDNALDSTDIPIAESSYAVSGGQTITDTITFAVPGNTPAGEFYYLLQVDPPLLSRPTGVIDEANETNNWVSSSGKVTISRSDLVIESTQFLDPVTDLPTLTARFGEPVRMKITFRNNGQANAINFKVGLVLSTDSSLSLLSDVTVASVSVASLAPGAPSQTVTIDGTMPLNNAAGVPYATGSTYYVFGQVDVTSAVPETNEQNNAQVIGPVRITAPGPDLAVTSVTAPAAAGVGEIVPVTRTIKNVGNRDATVAAYRYFASANDIITTDDVPLRILNGATYADEGQVTLTAGTAETKTELLELPTSMPAGTYFIGVIVDPALTVMGDLELTNNALASRSTAVAGSSLRIVNTALPDAIIGRPYSYRLSAAGVQAGTATWAIDRTRGDAPDWLTLGAADGTLSGMPTGTGAQVVGVTVTLENAGRVAVTRLALRVLPTSSGLEVTTLALPAVVNSSSTQYDYSLGAAGGVLPYSWRITTGTLPTGMSLSSSGQLTGAPRNTPNGTSQLTIEVRDAVGSRASRQLALRLIPAGAITFRTISIPDAIVGQEYLQDIAVMNLDGSALAKPLSWRVSGAVPTGLSVTPQSELITVAGRPSQAGTFSFTISVEDNNGRNDQLSFTMTVHAARYRVIFTPPEVLRPGESVSLPLSVSPAGTVTYRLVNGTLPPGLTLDPAGSINGTVAEDAIDAQWPFVIEASDSAGISGVSPLSLRVERAPRAAGCSSAVSDPSLWMLGLGALALLRRRRK
ncbi:MAG: putative Ig domain-containing protein [Archangium sp.]